ncbi:Centrosomal protein [Nymphon striatum]|nr:Centrosomal protein [Nymphon striatum]
MITFVEKLEVGASILNKRIPTNPKFNHVKPVVDTGASLSKHVEKINAMKSDFKYKSDEIFIRIKITTLVQLVNSRNYDEIEDANKDQSEKLTGPMEAKFISVVHGLGEMDLNQSNLIKHEKSDEPLPYLLLDVRHDDSFKQCRIKSAQNYPASMLNRSVNYETKELLQYKNKTDKVIIIYDENETIASVVSTTLVQRGYDNVFMLSGALEHLETLQEQLDHHLNKSSSYGLTWLLVYRTEKYQKLKSEVEKQSKKLEKKKEVLGDNIDKHHKKKIEREEERLKNNNRDLSLVKMKSMFAIGLAFTALLTHMGLWQIQENINDKIRIMVIQLQQKYIPIEEQKYYKARKDRISDGNVQKLLGFAPSRAANKHSGNIFGPTPQQFK